MIPKIIHYCWFGGKPMPQLAQKCIASWKKYLPDYEIKRWDESNFDVNQLPYTRDAYANGKYAFVSDYARFKILYEEGGIYLDTDVELVKSLCAIVENGPFMGEEEKMRCNPGVGIGAEPRMSFVKEMLDFYQNLNFITEDGGLNMQTIVTYTSDLLKTHGYTESNQAQLVAGFNIYPPEYFCPINYFTKELVITPKTYSIHHFAESWVSTRMKVYEMFNKVLGVETTKKIANFVHRYR